MGKRSKLRSNVGEPMPSKKRKIQNNTDSEESQLTHVQPSSLHSTNDKKKQKKANKLNETSSEDIIKEVTLETDTPCEHPAKKSKKSKTKEIKNRPAEETDGVNDEINQRKATDIAQSQEDDVRDEDIDKFCDEITEEDNVHYENWVKLIESKLSNNKKKST